MQRNNQNIIRQYIAIKSANETDKTESFHRYSTLPMDVLDKPPPQRLHQFGTGMYRVHSCMMFMMKGQALVHLIHFSGAKKLETAWHSMIKYEFSSYVPAQAVETCKHAPTFCDCDLSVRCFVPTCCGVLINLQGPAFLPKLTAWHKNMIQPDMPGGWLRSRFLCARLFLEGPSSMCLWQICVSRWLRQGATSFPSIKFRNISSLFFKDRSKSLRV